MQPANIHSFDVGIKSKDGPVCDASISPRDIERQPIVPEKDPFGKFSLDGHVKDIMSDVGEVGSSSAYAAGNVNGLIHAEVCWMRGQSQGIENEEIETAEPGVRFLRDRIAVGAVGGRSDAISVDPHRAMEKGNGDNLHPGNHKGALIDLRDVDNRKAAKIFLVVVERVVEDVLQMGERFAHHVQRDWAS